MKINCLAYKIQNPGIALSGGEDSSIQIWNLETGEPNHTIHETAPVTCVELINKVNNEWIIASASKNKITLWTLSSPQKLVTFQADSQFGIIRCIFADQTNLFTGHENGSILLWNLNNSNASEPLREFEDHEGAVTVIQADESKIISGSADKSIKIWEMNSKIPLSKKNMDRGRSEQSKGRKKYVIGELEKEKPKPKPKEEIELSQEERNDLEHLDNSKVKTKPDSEKKTLVGTKKLKSKNHSAI